MNQPAQVFTVSQLNTLIKQRIESEPRLLGCSVTGEISNFKHHSSGHMYLTLKDEKSRIRAIMFSSRARRLTFVPEDGMRVIVMGNVGVFDRDGQVQLYIDDMQPDGIGALYVAFTQLKEKLEREGLFDSRRKRQLVRYPMRIGVATSPTGSVIRDICSTLQRRYPLAKVILAPASVQGPGAAATIVQALNRLQNYSRRVAPLDAIIVARGGGSLEELWPFNEEIVARAIAACSIPVVSAVGHETDFTISDFVADVRAATPTAAAEVTAPSLTELVAGIQQFAERAKVALTASLKNEQIRLTRLRDSSVLQNPLRIVDVARQHVDYQEGRVRQLVQRPVEVSRRRLNGLGERIYRIDLSRRIERYKGRVDFVGQQLVNQVFSLKEQHRRNLNELIIRLEGLNPLQILRRGYSVVTEPQQDIIIHSIDQIKRGQLLSVRVSNGTFVARVESENAQEGEDSGRYEQARLDV